MCIPYTKGMVSCKTPKACAVMDNMSVSVYMGVSIVVEHTTLACLQGRQKCTCAALPANVLCVQHNQKLCGLSWRRSAPQSLDHAFWFPWAWSSPCLHSYNSNTTMRCIKVLYREQKLDYSIFLNKCHQPICLSANYFIHMSGSHRLVR